MSNDGVGGPPNLGDIARQQANEVYELSERCLMAHSIRAVEKKIGSHFIRVQERLNFSAKVGHPAIAYIKRGTTDIVVDRDLPLENKRRAIAHELGHIVLAHHNLRPGTSLGRRADRLTEDACGVFEKQLCVRHHIFYTTDSKLATCRFPSLDPKQDGQ